MKQKTQNELIEFAEVVYQEKAKKIELYLMDWKMN